MRRLNLRGCVEADVVGMGKTWIALGYLLSMRGPTVAKDKVLFLSSCMMLML